MGRLFLIILHSTFLMLHLFSASKADTQTNQGDCRVKIIICAVRCEEAQNIAVHGKSEDCNQTVDDAEEDEIQTSVRFTAHGGDNGDDTAEDVHRVVDRVHLEQAENRRAYEADDPYDEEDDAKNPCDSLDHRKKRRSKIAQNIPRKNMNW